MTSKNMALKGSVVEADDPKWRQARVQHRFLVLRKLGQGTYGKVQLALNKETNEEVAIKTIKKAKIESEEDMLRIRREIQIMSSIRHPHIIHINEVFETKQKIVLVMQYASGGELYDYLGCHHTLPEDEARRVFRQIASAIYYCHKNKICHRDLKLENILLDEEGNAQIADFGLSNIFDERRRMNTFCGSPLYASPEIVKGTPYKGPEVDCWSLGVLLYTLIYGTMPFDGRNFKDLVSQISEGRYEEPTNKSNASGLIRRLLTPDIAKRATIFDVCIDRWVNQGYSEPLVKIAEKMTSEALLKTRKLGAPKIYSESTNEIQEKELQTPISIQRNKENIVVNGKTDNSIYSQSEVSQKASLFEQMLKYDVNFVMNQLLSAVESANPMTRINDKNTLQGENLISALKPRNGENTGKVESAYVIPIFEVTSVMPKLVAKNIKNSNCEKSSQMCFSQNATANEFQFHSNSENKNKPKSMKKLTSNLSQLPSTPTDGKKIIQNGVEHTNLPNDSEKHNDINKHTVMTSKASLEKDPTKFLASTENMLPRMPSIKMKKPYDNPLLFGPKKPFFKNRNHSLSLARIFSMKYEKLVLDALKVPERKQKPPGKITIPATFDPSTSCDEAPERKEIVLLFPMVSVSENKEKIEKKIDKIKKAALNMNLIRRSNTNNRLRIQKFLRSQAKKMQDLVCDEHRSLAGSMEYIDQINGFPTDFCTFEKGSLNPFNIKHHNKKINFMNSNLSNSINPFAFDISNGEKWKFFGSENILTEEKENLIFFGIAKSKSDIQFPNNYSEYNMPNSSYRSSYSSGYNSLSNTLSVPNSDCSLLRSASDSDGLNCFRNTQTICTNKEYFAEGNISNVHYNGENFKIGESFFQNESRETHKTSDGETIQNSTDLSQNAKLDVDSIHQDGTRNINSLNNRNKEHYTIRRSISTSNCLSSQKISANDLQNIKRLLLTPMVRNNKENQVINEINNGSKYSFPSHINVLEENKISDEDKECLRRYSFNGDPNFNEEKLNLSWNEIKSMGADEIFSNYLWLPHGKQDLLTLYRKNDSKCLSSPNLSHLDLKKYNNFKIGNDFNRIDGFNIGPIENNDISEFSPLSQFANMQKSIKKSIQSKQRLQTSDSIDEAFYDFSPRYKNRAMSINDDTLINLESLLEYERKLSLPQGSQGKVPFLSKFLNDLERREQSSSTFDNSSSHNQKPCQRKAIKPPKRSKLEKRSQSFLQLLALKRIQEAEKELEKVERNNRIEDEDESGSLLEALKTHGYKGVISQRFQNQDDDDDAMLPLNLRNPTSHLKMRNYSPDMSYFPSMDYDTSPYLYSPYEDDDLDLEMLNGVTMRSLYEMYPGYKQNSPKQYIYDWLTANQNNEYSTSLRTDPTFEPEIPNTTKESESPSYWPKESPRSFDEASSSESFEFPKDQNTNGSTSKELNPARYSYTENGEFSNYVRHDRKKLLRTPSAPERYEDYSKYASRDRHPSEDDEFSNYVRSDRNPLLRTTSAPEEEKEESVQDRIWRKSFYSRFNNSVLSRKERSSFLDTCDSRAGFRERSLTPFKITSRDKLDKNGCNGLQSKRIGKRRSSSSSDRTLDSGLSASIKHIPLERTPTNTTITNEMDETDPEH